MPIIGQGRTAGGYAVIQNSTLDGLLQYGGVDLAGFYLALKRFIDRREDPTSNHTMDWSIKYFCKKFSMGQQRFYRLAEQLWQLGLLDVEKVTTPDGWQNKYLVHDYPAYQGPLRPIRQGTFKYRRSEEVNLSEQEEKVRDTTGPEALPIRNPNEDVPEAGDDGEQEEISETGIPESDIPETGISAAGIPAADTLIKDKRDENKKGGNPSVRQSVFLERASPSVKDRPRDRLIDFSDHHQVIKYYQEAFGATERQVRMAMLSVQAQLDKGTVIMDYKAYFEKTLTQLLQEEDFRRHFV